MQLVWRSARSEQRLEEATYVDDSYISMVGLYPHTLNREDKSKQEPGLGNKGFINMRAYIIVPGRSK